MSPTLCFLNSDVRRIGVSLIGHQRRIVSSIQALRLQFLHVQQSGFHVWNYTYTHTHTLIQTLIPATLDPQNTRAHTHTPQRSGLTDCHEKCSTSVSFYQNPMKISSWNTYMRKQSQRPWRNMLNVMNCLSSWWTVCNRKIGPFTQRNHSKQWNNGTILLLWRCHLSIILQVLWLTGLQIWELWIVYLLF